MPDDLTVRELQTREHRGTSRTTLDGAYVTSSRQLHHQGTRCYGPTTLTAQIPLGPAFDDALGPLPAPTFLKLPSGLSNVQRPEKVSRAATIRRLKSNRNDALERLSSAVNTLALSAFQTRLRELQPRLEALAMCVASFRRLG